MNRTAIFLIIITFLVSCGGQSLTLSLNQETVSELPILYGIEMGFFKDEGIHIELVEENADLMSMDVVQLVQSDSRKVIAFLQGQPAILFRREAQNEGILKAALSVGDASELLMDLYLENFYNYTKELVENPLSEFRAGNADLMVVQEPEATRLTDNSDSKLSFRGININGIYLLTASEEVLNERSEDIQAFLRAYEASVASLNQENIPELAAELFKYPLGVHFPEYRMDPLQFPKSLVTKIQERYQVDLQSLLAE
jgi:ABC-type nitrate/sulfonate/bicarbonate transport system substrate-binding protein